MRFDHVLRAARLMHLSGRPDDARALWSWLGHALAVHIRYEEELLLPELDASAIPDNGGPQAILRDHVNIRATLSTPLPEDPVRAQGLLADLAGLLEHHDERESRWFKPVLDGQLDAELKAGLLAQIAETEAALVDPPVVGGPPVQRELASLPRPTGDPVVDGAAWLEWQHAAACGGALELKGHQVCSMLERAAQSLGAPWETKLRLLVDRLRAEASAVTGTEALLGVLARQRAVSILFAAARR